MTSPRSTAARARFAALADVIIPAGGGLPAASEAGVHEALLDRAIRAHAALEDTLQEVLDGHDWAEDPATVVRRLHHEQPIVFERLLTLVAGAYYIDSGVRKAMGYPGQRPQPMAEPDADLPELLAPVAGRPFPGPRLSQAGPGSGKFCAGGPGQPGTASAEGKP